MHSQKILAVSAVAAIVLVVALGLGVPTMVLGNIADGVVEEILLQGGLADEERTRPCATAVDGRLYCNKRLHDQDRPEVMRLVKNGNKATLFSTRTGKYCADRGDHIVCNSNAPVEFGIRGFNNNARIAFQGKRGWCVDKSSNIDCSASDFKAQQSRFVVTKSPATVTTTTVPLPTPAPEPLPSSSTVPSPETVTTTAAPADPAPSPPSSPSSEPPLSNPETTTATTTDPTPSPPLEPLPSSSTAPSPETVVGPATSPTSSPPSEPLPSSSTTPSPQTVVDPVPVPPTNPLPSSIVPEVLPSSSTMPMPEGLEILTVHETPFTPALILVPIVVVGGLGIIVLMLRRAKQ